MAVGKRFAGVLPLAGATAVAMTLAGVAVFTVNQAGCSDAGRYVQRDDEVVELVGGCVDPADLPNAPSGVKPGNPPAEPASNPLGQFDRAQQVP